MSGDSVSGESNYLNEDKYYLGYGIDDGSTSLIKRIQIRDYYDGDYISIDNLTYESMAVPVPATIWLFGSGFIGLIATIRKK